MTITEQYIEQLLSVRQLQNSENELQKIPIEVERQIYDFIRNGDYDKIHLSPFSKILDNLGEMSSDFITQLTYITVSAIAIWTRVAIDGGTLPDDAFDLSDVLLSVLSKCRTQEEIFQVYQVSAVMFAKQVHRQKQKTSYQVTRVLDYISRNIFQKITLEDAAQYIGLSPHYLCNLFSQEMGISLHNYIQREKIKLSCNLLIHSDRPVSVIATYMGFQTPSNYTSVFRKWMGMSPTQYRQANYREVY